LQIVGKSKGEINAVKRFENPIRTLQTSLHDKGKVVICFLCSSFHAISTGFSLFIDRIAVPREKRKEREEEEKREGKKRREITCAVSQTRTGNLKICNLARYQRHHSA
jgi:hypothetical protein